MGEGELPERSPGGLFAVEGHAVSWVSKTRMEKMLSASGTLAVEVQWGEGSEEGGMPLAHRRCYSVQTAGFPITVPHKGGSSSSVQQLTATGVLRGWGERESLPPKPSMPHPSNFTITVLGEGGCSFSLCMTISIAVISLHMELFKDRNFKFGQNLLCSLKRQKSFIHSIHF